jgi:hypothetical protein
VHELSAAWNHVEAPAEFVGAFSLFGKKNLMLLENFIYTWKM